jgi:hypothetical protein
MQRYLQEYLEARFLCLFLVLVLNQIHRSLRTSLSHFTGFRLMLCFGRHREFVQNHPSLGNHRFCQTQFALAILRLLSYAKKCLFHSFLLTFELLLIESPNLVFH